MGAAGKKQKGKGALGGVYVGGGDTGNQRFSFFSPGLGFLGGGGSCGSAMEGMEAVKTRTKDCRKGTRIRTFFEGSAETQEKKG